MAILERPFVQELGISVSELLTGEKIEAEHYQERDRKILVSSISKRKRSGYRDRSLWVASWQQSAMNLRACFHIKKQRRLNMGIYKDHCCVSYRFQ
ncbi:MAG: hypothetical protein ACLSGB_14930 [Dorea sp.]